MFLNKGNHFAPSGQTRKFKEEKDGKHYCAVVTTEAPNGKKGWHGLKSQLSPFHPHTILVCCSKHG